MKFITLQLKELNRNNLPGKILRRIYLSVACARYGEAEGNGPIARDLAAIRPGARSAGGIIEDNTTTISA